jgi:TRAP-type C4-dicarboxylate transport system permease large subunit
VVASVLVLGALLIALGLGVSPNIDTNLVQIGEWIWPGYASELRFDPEKPDCDLADIDAKLAACPAGGEAPAEGTPAGGDPFGGEDPFGGGEAGATPPPAPSTPAVDPGDPFAADGDPFAGGGDPFAENQGTSAGTSCTALKAYRETCGARWQQYDTIVAKSTDTSRTYRAFEVFVGDLAKFPYWKHLLIVVVVLAALSTGAHRMAIALRDARTLSEHRVAQGSQVLAFGLLVASNVADYGVQMASEAERENPEIPLFWAIGFALLAGVSLFHLVVTPQGVVRGATNAGRLLMVVPLFAYMVVIGGVYFLVAEGHPSGLAIFLSKLLQVPRVYLGVGLYLWAGMLFSLTRVAPIALGVLRPWQLPPSILAWIFVVGAAVPTAYSGASGIFVLAAGAVLFEQLRKAGATPRLALAATAMSGSLGVVLAPCLVIVLIAALNNDVTTSELFGSGIWVFALTAVLSLVGFIAREKTKFVVPDVGRAWAATGRALLALLPYAGLSALVVAAYTFLLATPVNENTAMLVLPAMLLVLVFYDRVYAPPRVDNQPLPRSDLNIGRSLVTATGESSDHIGAILMLMIGSIIVGGVVERTEVMSYFPAQIGGPYVTMTVLVVAMVLVGMTMDALGAVVLVSASLAGLATASGIHAVHFWLMVLVAFELGYLSPPVALNQLLARQVVGQEAHVEEDDVRGAWNRNEHWLLPVVIMATALILVAYGGFFFFPPRQVGPGTEMSQNGAPPMLEQP